MYLGSSEWTGNSNYIFGKYVKDHVLDFPSALYCKTSDQFRGDKAWNTWESLLLKSVFCFYVQLGIGYSLWADNFCSAYVPSHNVFVRGCDKETFQMISDNEGNLTSHAFIGDLSLIVLVIYAYWTFCSWLIFILNLLKHIDYVSQKYLPHCFRIASWQVLLLTVILLPLTSRVVTICSLQYKKRSSKGWIL